MLNRQRPQQRCVENSCETNRSKANSRSMPCRALRIRSGWFGGTTALLLGAAIVFVLGLSVSPNLHERLHPTAATFHECAATLIASGHCEQNAPPQGAPKLENAPNSPVFLPQRFQSVIAAVPSSIQEHAPPASH
jgi:hypothetical protein